MTVQDDLEERVTKAYFRRFGPNADQPAGIDREATPTGQRFTLYNVNGELAVYKWNKTTDRLAYRAGS